MNSLLLKSNLLTPGKVVNFVLNSGLCPGQLAVLAHDVIAPRQQ
jgi:hypothetical protein